MDVNFFIEIVALSFNVCILYLILETKHIIIKLEKKINFN